MTTRGGMHARRGSKRVPHNRGRSSKVLPTSAKCSPARCRNSSPLRGAVRRRGALRAGARGRRAGPRRRARPGRGLPELGLPHVERRAGRLGARGQDLGVLLGFSCVALQEGCVESVAVAGAVCRGALGTPEERVSVFPWTSQHNVRRAGHGRRGGAGAVLLPGAGLRRGHAHGRRGPALALPLCWVFAPCGRGILNLAESIFEVPSDNTLHPSKRCFCGPGWLRGDCGRGPRELQRAGVRPAALDSPLRSALQSEEHSVEHICQCKHSFYERNYTSTGQSLCTASRPRLLLGC